VEQTEFGQLLPQHIIPPGLIVTICGLEFDFTGVVFGLLKIQGPFTTARCICISSLVLYIKKLGILTLFYLNYFYKITKTAKNKS